MVALAATFADQPVLTLGIFVGTLALGWAIVRFAPPIVTEKRRNSGETAVALIELVILVLLALFALAQIATLSQVGGLWLTDQLNAAAIGLGPVSLNFGFVGNFFKVMGDMVTLMLPAATALLGATIAMLLGSRLGQEAILRISGVPAKLLTAVTTFLGTAVFIYGIGTILNWLYQFDTPANWTTVPALVGGGVLAVGSLLVAPKRPFRIGFGIYTIARAIFNTLRSIEPLIMAIIFVVWVGLGPFAGVMALTLHTIAALGKLFSEQIEGIDDGPIEAINATGANRLQMIVFAVIPQIIPPYIAYTLYRWDINVRMSTIIGFVGGGGIGFLLSQSVRLLRYREASVMMLAIAIVVSLLDYLSANVRRRVI
ncbi:MAG: phosphonate ABC transporter, permease protein PhnE [Anaerolineaceae bacterium]|nr:phosphonate ABC transporter, permease protein PhnE [Anaerolineaceae bacterium]